MTFSIDTIRDRIPGYREAGEQLARLAQVPPPTARSATAVEQTRDDLLAALAAGDDVAAMLLPAAQDALSEVEAVTVARAAMTQARVELEDRRRQAIVDGTDVVLAGLAEALEEMVAEVRDLAPLHEIADTEAAVAADRGHDLKRLRQIATAYTHLRGEEWRLLEQDGDLDYPIAGALRDPVAAFPDLGVWHRFPGLECPWPVVTDGASYSFGERGGSDGRARFKRDSAHIGFMLWAVEHEHELWVPPSREAFRATARQVDAAVLEAAEANRVELGARPQQPLSIF